MIKQNIHRIIISRTDAIGDVILSLPLAGILKKYFPQCTVIFFGKTYTRPVINACTYVDEFANYDDFEKLSSKDKKIFMRGLNADVIIHVFPRKSISSAAAATIKYRIGTTNRVYHWWTCNKLVRLSRKNSLLHEAQLNTKLLNPLHIKNNFRTEELSKLFGLKKIKLLPEHLKKYLSTNKFNLILHPKSNVSAREWSLENYRTLINLLPEERFNIVITGAEKEKTLLNGWVQSLPSDVKDCVGKMSLDELISFIASADGLVAASTGPLHLAAALGKHALGIYPPIRPMHPGRWKPLGEKADYIVVPKKCAECKGKPMRCHCINEVTPEQVADRISGWNILV